jgi:hypothetical protein
MRQKDEIPQYIHLAVKIRMGVWNGVLSKEKQINLTKETAGSSEKLVFIH